MWAAKAVKAEQTKRGIVNFYSLDSKRLSASRLPKAGGPQPPYVMFSFAEENLGPRHCSSSRKDSQRSLKLGNFRCGDALFGGQPLNARLRSHKVEGSLRPSSTRACDQKFLYVSIWLADSQLIPQHQEAKRKVQECAPFLQQRCEPTTRHRRT